MATDAVDEQRMHAPSGAGSHDLLVTRLRGGQAHVGRDTVAVEEPLEIQVALGDGPARPVAITMRTPGHDHELAVGFLVGEGVLRAREELLQVGDGADAGSVIVRIAPSLGPRLPSTGRHFYRTSSCGICGKSAIAALQAVPFARAIATGPLPASVLLALPDALLAAQPGHGRTGSLHAAGLFDFTGRLLAVREDVGRHNALDKLLAWAWLAGRLPLLDHVLMLSGRASFELVQKAMAGGLPVVAAIGAPSSLAVDLAHEAGITLAGFVRDGGANLYSHAGRILPGDPAHRQPG